MGQNGGTQKDKRTHKWKSVANREKSEKERWPSWEFGSKSPKVRLMLFCPLCWFKFRIKLKLSRIGFNEPIKEYINDTLYIWFVDKWESNLPKIFDIIEIVQGAKMSSPRQVFVRIQHLAHFDIITHFNYSVMLSLYWRLLALQPTANWRHENTSSVDKDLTFECVRLSWET